MYHAIIDFVNDSYFVISHRLLGAHKPGQPTGNTRHQKSTRTDNGLTYGQFEARCLLAGISFTAETGQVVIGGTQGNDTVLVTQSGDTVTVSPEGFDAQTFSASEVQSLLFVGLAGDDFFENRTAISSEAHGQGGNDTLIGGSGADRLIGQSGNDRILAGAGDDFIFAGNDDDFVDAGEGNDHVLGVRGTNTISGGEGDDLIFGGEGDDTISDVSGNNTLVGSDGVDLITGGTGEDLVFGGNGNDVIRGLGGNDRLYGQGGDDFISGGSGDDIVSGNDGNDELQGERGDDQVVGGNGTDQANYSGGLVDYEAEIQGAFLAVNDLRGPNFSRNDLTFAIEEYNFSDGVRTPSEVLSPTPAPPLGNIREVVTIQPIIASNSDGSNTAEYFGTPQQQADILNRIDAIFGQANIDIEFLPAVEINDTFTNVGAGSGNRTSGDLDRIITNGDASGVGSSNRSVIDLYFVERVPGFGDVSDTVANGLAFVGAPGAAVHIGDNLVDFSAGRQTIAEVTAHEIGHNLGLSHVNISGNLLSSSASGSDLSNSQINTILRSSLSQPVTTSGTLVQIDLPSIDNTQADSLTSIGGCGGCGVCGACTGAIASS